MMTDGTRRTVRFAAWFFIAIGVAALIADFAADDPVPLRYIVGAIVLIGLNATILYYFWGSRK